MDKQPLIVCFSTGTTLPGEKKVRHRSKLQQGEVVKAQYTLEQPQVHALYRKYFNAVDLFNKASGQPGTLPDVWKTKKAYRRLFAATVAWIETNAMLAFNKNRGGSKLTKQQWFMRLSEACINNPFAPPRPGAADIFQGHGGPKMDSHANCWVCGTKTKWKCFCGRAVCGPTTRAVVRGGPKRQPNACYDKHKEAVLDGNVWHTGVATPRRGPKPKRRAL
ncbi:MAG: hypothetical protein EB119_10125 [Synechococcaceae bacterium WBB_34_004]|nr:hypothetical protein [Synechococcaceae bacterium WBB_34_004]